MSRQNPLERVETLVDRVNDRVPVPDRLSGDGLGDFERPGTPATDVAESPTEYEVTVELPGFTRGDVSVRLAGQTLYVDAARGADVERSGGGVVRRDRARESQSRQITFPEPVDGDEVSATMHNGLLRITVPKAMTSSRTRDVDVS